ncbi:MAG: response regulator [Methylophaga sp.]|nr:MAG: response regulator [Methylophaga sp.]
MANILAVDDSASMRQMVSFTLKAAGHTVTDAADGKQALDIAKTRSFDLVLTDVNMPVMDGLTLTRELRALPAFKFTPVLVLTTEAGMDKKQEGRAAGATGWLVKPFNPDQLIATINKVLG